MKLAKLLKNVGALALTTVVLIGCQSTENSQSTTEVSIKPTFNAFVSSNGYARSTDVTKLYTGSMEVLDIDNVVVDTQDWSVYLESDNSTGEFVAVSNKSLTLVPGQYTFNLSLSKGEHAYFGSSIVDVSDGEFEIVPMIIKPILGTSNVDSEVAERISEFKLSFEQAHLEHVGATHLSITINDGASTVLILDQSSAINNSVSIWHVIEPGEQSIKLELLKDGEVIAHSVNEQELQSIYFGKGINMDLIPLFAEIGLNISENGADAIFNFVVPNEVLMEVDGAHNLDVRFQLNGDFNETDQLLSTLTNDASGNGHISITLPEFQYDTMDLVLTFIDNQQDEVIGNCTTVDVVLNQNPANLNCDITLRRRGAIGGTLLANYAINTFDAQGNAVTNASIFIDGELIGMTGSNLSLNAGYLNVFIQPGEHEVSAESTNLIGMQHITALPLSVNNIDIILNFDMDFNIPVVLQIDKALAPTPPSGMKVTCMTSSESLVSSSTCPVIEYNEIQFWPFSYIDNRSSIGLVGYQNGQVVTQKELSGARYVWDVTVNEDNETISILGQSNGLVNVDWAELEIPNIPVVVQIDKILAPTPPAGMKVTCMTSSDSLVSSSTCPVIEYNEIQFWPFSYIDNRSSIGLVGYQNGQVVTQQELSGTRYVWDVTVNEDNETISILGQANGSVNVDWAELEIPNIPVVVQIDKILAPTPPTGMKVTCMTSSDSLVSSSTCPVIEYNEIQFWPFSYIDNRSSIGLTGYQNGQVVSQQELTGTRYVWDVTLNEANESITIFGQASGIVSLNWQDL